MASFQRREKLSPYDERYDEAYREGACVMSSPHRMSFDHSYFAGPCGPGSSLSSDIIDAEIAHEERHENGLEKAMEFVHGLSGVNVIELSLTENRHEIISELTSEVVTQSIFPNTVEQVMNLKEHIQVTNRVFNSLESFSHCIVYITGLTILVQALYISWSKHILANGKHRYGKLIFAHRDRTSDSYKLFCSQTGESIDSESLSEIIKFNRKVRVR